MMRDTEAHISDYDGHLCFKHEPEETAIENIQATHPLELVHLDYLATEAAESGKDTHVLIIMYHFMGYEQALATTSQTAKWTAQALWNRLVVHYGLPESIISDQGKNFEGDLIVEFCKMTRV